MIEMPIIMSGPMINASGKRRKKPVILDGLEYWKCGTCKIYKPSSEFYADGKTSSGISSVCRKCHTECSMRTRDRDNARELNAIYMRRARKKNPEKFRERERIVSKERRLRDRTKVLARSTLNNAVKSGKISKPKICTSCKRKTRVTGHHKDYSKPLKVKWLCYSCHGKKHRTIAKPYQGAST